MPRPRYQNVEPARRQRLLEAAAREFAREGYEMASISRILEEAGFSKGSFYYYFDDKADLAATVMIEEANALLESLKELRPPENAEGFWNEMRRYQLERIKVLASRRTQYEAMMRLAHAMGKDPALAQRVLSHFSDARKTIGGLMERGVALGAVRTDLPMGVMIEILESVKMTLYRALYPDDRTLTEAELQSFADLMGDLTKRLMTPSPKAGGEP